MSLHWVADRMFVLPKRGRSLRSEIVLILVVGGGDGGDSGFCTETITCSQDAEHDTIDPPYFR
jgi:hypothetical protein